MFKSIRSAVFIITIMGLLSACSNSVTLPKPTELKKIDTQVDLVLAWQTPIGVGAKAYMPPLVPIYTKDKVYTVAHAGQVSAVDANTGKKIWQVKLSNPISAGIGSTESRLLVATNDGALHMLNGEDGSHVWRIKTSSEVLAVPQANDQIVLVQSIDGYLTAYEVVDGSLVWSYLVDVPNLTLRGTSTPLINDNIVYAGFANGKLLAFELTSGEILWQQRIGIPMGRSDMQRIVDIDAPLRLVDNILYVTGFQGSVTAVDAYSGQIKWQQSVSSHAPPIIFGDRVFVVTDKSSILAFDRQDGLPAWQTNAFLHRNISNLVAASGVLIAADSLGYVHVIDQATGQAIGRLQTGHWGSAVGYARHGKHIYMLGQDATLFAISIKSL